MHTRVDGTSAAHQFDVRAIKAAGKATFPHAVQIAPSGERELLLCLRKPASIDFWLIDRRVSAREACVAVDCNGARVPAAQIELEASIVIRGHVHAEPFFVRRRQPKRRRASDSSREDAYDVDPNAPDHGAERAVMLPNHPTVRQFATDGVARFELRPTFTSKLQLFDDRSNKYPIGCSFQVSVRCVAPACLAGQLTSVSPAFRIVSRPDETRVGRAMPADASGYD